MQISATAAGADVELEVDVEVAEGYTITQFVDKMIDVFLNEKPKSRDWKKYLIFRDEWGKYRDRFYNRCKTRADAEHDSQIKQKLIDLSKRVRKVLFSCLFIVFVSYLLILNWLLCIMSNACFDNLFHSTNCAYSGIVLIFGIMNTSYQLSNIDVETERCSITVYVPLTLAVLFIAMC